MSRCDVLDTALNADPGRWMALLAVAALCGCIDIPEFSNDAGPDVAAVPDVGELVFECADFTGDSFQCGGDPIGDWTITLGCPAASTYDPLAGTCEELEASGAGSAEGTLSIDRFGEYELRLDRRDLDVEFSFPLDCYGGSRDPCDGAVFSGQCEVIVDEERCQCGVRSARAPLAESGTWRRRENVLTFTTDDAAYSLQYCRVAPDALYVFRFPVGGDVGWGFAMQAQTP